MRALKLTWVDDDVLLATWLITKSVYGRSVGVGLSNVKDLTKR